MPRVISADQIDFAPDASTPVVSDTLRFVIPVPRFKGGGEPLVQPDGGEFLDWSGKPISGRGVVFFNPDDQCYQAAHGDGEAVVIVGGIDEDEAERLRAKIAAYGPDPNHFTLAQFKELLAFIRDEAGSVSIYDSDRASVAKTMTRAEPGTGIDAYGLFRRNRQDLCAAVFVPGKGLFQGPAATPQRFDHGAVILRHGEDVRLVQVGSFEATYKHPDGRAIHAADLKTQSP